VARGRYLGIAASRPPCQWLPIVNLDAHFGLRRRRCVERPPLS